MLSKDLPDTVVLARIMFIIKAGTMSASTSKKLKMRKSKIPIFLTPLQAKRVLNFIEDYEGHFRNYYGHTTTVILHFRDWIEKGKQYEGKRKKTQRS